MAANHPVGDSFADPVQLEKGVPEAHTSTSAADIKIVSWDSECDPLNPYNWSKGRKWFTTILTSLGGLVTLMSGVMLAPALTVISEDLDMSEAEASMALSIYVLAFAFGPMILAPCSEVWGRKPIWIVGGSVYVLWNTLCGLSKGRGLMIAGRLMSGLGASAEFAVSGPIVSDIWSADERGKSIAIRSFLPLLGPAIGPTIGGVMVQELSWRWLFYVLSIFDGIIILLFIFFLPETHAQTLLGRKASRLRRSTGEPYYAEHESDAPTLIHRIRVALLRPTKLLCKQPVIQLISLVMGYQFGILYIVHSTFANLWIDRYKQSSTASGLHYLAIVLGFLAGLHGGGWALDRVWAWLKAKDGGQVKPENRVPLLVPGSLIMSIGLLWYGWAAEKPTRWIVTDIGIAIFGCGYIAGTTAAQAYVVEAFLDHTASAGAAATLPRNIFAFAFPIFAPSLYVTLGYGQGNTLLAGISLALGLPAPYILWKYGGRLRRKGGPAL